MATDTVEERIEAGATSSDSPAGTEASPAKEADKVLGETLPAEGKSSQDTASTDDSEDAKEPEKGKPVPWQQWDDMRTKRNKLRDHKNELAELGIHSKEDAAFLRREADRAERLDSILDQLENSPKEFFAELQKEYPDQWKEHVENVGSQAVLDYLVSYAAGFRKRGKEGDAETAAFLDRLADELAGTKRPEGEREKPKGSSLSDERWEFFAERVAGGIESSLTEAIHALTKETEFRNETQKRKFLGIVLSDLRADLEKDDGFTRQRNAAQSEKRGLTREQVGEVIDVYARHAKARGRLERIVTENLSLMGLGTSKVKSDGKTNVSTATGRREVLGSGATPGNTVSEDAKGKLKREIAAKGLSGADATTAFLAGMRKLRTGT